MKKIVTIAAALVLFSSMSLADTTTLTSEEVSESKTVKQIVKDMTTVSAYYYGYRW